MESKLSLLFGLLTTQCIQVLVHIRSISFSSASGDCEPGYYISGSDCLPCGFAQYQPMRHQEMCLNCSEKQNTSSVASTSQSDCQLYCPAGEEGNVTCTKCQQNYYKPTEGLATCEVCTGNYTSNDDRVACTVLFCDRGFYNDNDNCMPCPIGQYKEMRGNAQSCTVCDRGFTTSDVASDNRADCNVLYCVPGKFENTTTKMCEYCKIKTYKISAGNEACTDCPQDKTTQEIGSTMASDCSIEFCDPGNHRTTSNKCELCAVGHYQPEAGNDMCIPCDAGYTTESTGKVSKSDCYEICKVGFQFNANNKVCTGCPLGYYKDVVGNHVNCSQCPVNKTTGYVNSTSQSDCSIDDCQPGYKRQAGGMGCMKCEIGTYQDQRSQTSCKSCDGSKTTKTTGSSKVAQCISTCNPGQEVNYYTGQCENCIKGFISDTNNRECYACPNGQTTISAGSPDCIPQIVTTLSPPVRRIVIIDFIYRGAFQCNDANVLELVRGKVIFRLTVLSSVYTRLCYPDAANCVNVQTLQISVQTCVAARRKRSTNNIITFKVVVKNFPDSVTNIENQRIRPTSTVLQEDLTANREEYNPLPNLLNIEDAKLVSFNPQCPTGSIVNLQTDNCEMCPVGSYHDSTTNACHPCPVNTYQELTGQPSCKFCNSVKKYTLSTGSNNSFYCVSECVTQVNYCNTGTCRDDFSLLCVCSEEYEGSRCEIKKEKNSSILNIIGGATGGAVALLIIIIICLTFYRRNKANDYESPQNVRNDDEERYADLEDPIYVTIV